CDNAQRAPRYAGLADRTRAHFLDACCGDLEIGSSSSWGVPPRHYLSAQPVDANADGWISEADGVEVRIDGERIPEESAGGSNWRYHSQTNAIDFRPGRAP